MATTPVTTTVSGSPFSVNVTAATLDINNATRDFLVLENGTLTLNPNSYTKVSTGTALQYNGPALPALTTLEIRRRTPRNIRVVQAVGTKIRSADWNAEFDRLVRIAEEYDIYGAGGGFSVRLPLDGAFGPGWNGDILFPPTRNAVYDELITKATTTSPVFTGNPTAPTPATNDSSTSIATTSYVKSNLGAYAPLASPALTGSPTAPTPVTADASTLLATTSYVKNQLINTPLTGVPTAPTAAAATNNTQLATTQFVRRAARPMCILERITSAVNIPTIGVFTNVMYNSKLRDVDNAYNTTTGLFTAPYNGFYQFNVFMRSSQTAGTFIASVTTTASTELVRIGELLATASSAAVVSSSVVCYITAGSQVAVCGFTTVLPSTIVNNSTSGVRALSGCSVHYLGDDA